MTQQALPQGILIAQANGLMNTERAFPLGAPPIPIAQGLLSIASALPQTALPLPGIGGAGGILPSLAGLSPLGTTPNILASLMPQAPPAPRPNVGPNGAYARTGLG